MNGAVLSCSGRKEELSGGGGASCWPAEVAWLERLAAPDAVKRNRVSLRWRDPPEFHGWSRYLIRTLPEILGRPVHNVAGSDMLQTDGIIVGSDVLVRSTILTKGSAQIGTLKQHHRQRFGLDPPSNHI